MQSTERSTRSSKRFVPDAAQKNQSTPTDTGQYMCIECSETFDTKLELNSHRQSHVTKKQFTCSHCGRGFHHQVFLQMHERSHEDGISHSSLTKAPAGRVISTRSSKSSLGADVIHVAPIPTKPSYQLNSKVHFKSGEKVNKDITPRQCVTRHTRGTSPPARQRKDSSDKKTFELRISKLSDSTIQVIDPFGNTLEILAEVFNNYTIGESEDDESVSPTGDSEISVAPSSSPVPPDTADETAQDPELPSEVSEPSEPIDNAETVEDLPLCGVESVSSASISPKTAPDFIDDAEDVLSTHSPHVSDTKDITDSEHVVHQPISEMPHSSLEEGILPSCAQDSLIIKDGQNEGPMVEDVSVCNNELSEVIAGTPSLKTVSLDDPNSVHLEDSEMLHSACLHTEDIPSIIKSLSPDQLQEEDSDASCHTPITENERDSSLKSTSSLSDMDITEDIGQLDTSCVRDSIDLENDRVMSLPGSVDENHIITQNNALESSNLSESAQFSKEGMIDCLDKRHDETVVEYDQTNALQRSLTLREHVSESECHKSVSSDTSSLIHDPGLQTDPSPANIVSNSPVDNAEEKINEKQTTSINELELCSHTIHDETECNSCPAQVCSSEPNSQKTHVVMSLDLPEQKNVDLSNQEGDSTTEDIGEKVHILEEKEASEAIAKPDKLSQIAISTVPILQEAQCLPEQAQELHVGDDQNVCDEIDLFTIKTSQKNVGISESNPADDPSMSLSSPLHDVQPQSSSHLDTDVNLTDTTEMEANVSSVDMMHIVTETKENQLGQTPEETPAPSLEDLSLANIENVTFDPTEENIPASVQVLQSKDVERTPVLESCEGKDVERTPGLESCEGKDVERTPGLESCEGKDVERTPGLESCEGKDVERTPGLESCEGKDVERTPVLESCEDKDVERTPGLESCEGKDVERTPGLESCEGNLLSLFESAVGSAGDVSMPPCDEVLRSPDVAFNVQSLVSITSAYVKAQEHFLTQGIKPVEQDAVTSLKMNDTLISTTSIDDAMLLDKLQTEDSVTTLCLLEPTLGLSPDLEDLSEKCLLSNDDVKDLTDHDLDKNLSQEVPHKQYIQMSNANLTENDLAEDFVDSDAILLDPTNLDDTPKEDDISAVSVDQSPVHELSDMLSPDIQESECTEDPDDKHVGIGSQCIKCGRKIRRARKEMVWRPTCYKCRIKSKREERHAGDVGCCSPDFVLEKGFDRKKGSPDFSSFHIKEEAGPAHDDPSDQAAKSVHNMQLMKKKSAAPQRKYKCPKCEKVFRIPSLLSNHMKCHLLPQCITCGCPMMLKHKTKRIPKRCRKCFHKIKKQKKKQKALTGGDDSLDSDSGSPFVDEVDLQDQVENEPKLKGVYRDTEPPHSIIVRKRKKKNSAIQALYCTCDVVLKSGTRQPKMCKNCQKPVRARMAHSAGIAGKPSTLKATKKPLSSQRGKEEDDDFCKEQEMELTDSDISDQMVLQDGEKPRLCPQCGKIFKCNRSLNLHLLSHTATQCESCGCRLQKKRRAGRWSKRCRVCRLLTKDKGLPDSAIEEDLQCEKIFKEKNMTLHRLKMKQSKIVKSRKIQSIAKRKKDLKWMNMILAVKGLTRKPRKKKGQPMKSSTEEKTGYSSDTVKLVGEDKDPGTSGLHISQKKVLGGIQKVNRKCMYREKNIIKVEEHQLPPYSDDLSIAPVSVKEEEKSQCLECDEIFSNLDLLLSHQQGHVHDQPFVCPQCPQSFSTEQYLTIHIGTHAEGPPFRCLECNKTFTRRNHLGVHRRVHTGSRPYACPDCPCKFRQKGSLIIHRYTHRNLQFMMLKPYQCSVCDKSFKQKERLVIHERLHTGECPFSCKDCDKVFPSKSRLYVHRKLHRVGDASSSLEKKGLCNEEAGRQPFQCKDCGKICSTKASLVLHCKVHKSSAIIHPTGGHKENPEEETKETLMASKQELDIKSEAEVHPFTCKDCGKVCSTKASLVRHGKVHGLSPAFVCKKCNKVCSTKGSLVLHRKIHKPQLMYDIKVTAGDPPYTCPDCNKICSTKASFVLHFRVHRASASSQHMLKTNMERKTFVCKDCGFVCSTKGSFVLHRKVHRASPSFNLKDGPGDHPFTCKDCNKVCSTKASLVLHRRVHKTAAEGDKNLISQAQVEDKPYHCKDCGKLYSTKGRLLSHMKLHASQDGSADGGQELNLDTEEKPFSCPVCNMRFTRMKILVRHKLLHSEEVFSCVHCGKRFLFQKSLMNHVPICLKRSKRKSLGKDKVLKKRKNKDESNAEEGPPKKRKYTRRVMTATQKLKNKKLIKAKKLAISKEKGKTKKPKKAKTEAEQEPEAEGKEQSDEKLLETPTKEKEIGKDKKPKDVGKVKKVIKKVPQKQKRQNVGSESLKKWRIIAAATVKKRKLQAVISGGKKKVTVKKKGPSKAKTGGKSSKE
ncbi:uncharacterized protein [Ranitomeya imitator]|uniref:uncharacterized protein n=1 Tax=Ranitomeya imitator TaxID=111125 RepID=UPI0037E71512